MKKVKIVTFHRTNSHGALLQAYSLHSFISYLGYDVQFIDYSTRDKPQLEPFRKYANEYLVKTKRIKKYDELSQIDADILICGSDQIWNLDITLSENLEGRWEFYFLDFGKSSTKRIAYAASCGGNDIPEKQRDNAKFLLNNFNHIAVREEASKNLISELVDMPIDIVLDPVFLINEFHIKKPKFELPERYIVLISLQRNAALYEIVRIIKEYLNLPVVISDYSLGKCPVADINLPPLRPDEWLYIIRNSNFVCTNSFHATSFALKFRKQFITIPLLKPSRYEGLYRRMVERIYQMKLNKVFSYLVKRPLSTGIKQVNINNKMCRIEEILSVVDLKSRIIMNSNDIFKSFEAIDYVGVENKLAPLILHSKNYLNLVLKHF